MTVTKFLGVLIDENLTWIEHITEIEKKVSKSIGILYRARDILTSNDLYLLYCSLVLPYLQYCVIIWGHNYKSRLIKIIKLQEKAIRIATHSTYDTHTTI